MGSLQKNGENNRAAILRMLTAAKGFVTSAPAGRACLFGKSILTQPLLQFSPQARTCSLSRKLFWTHQ